MDSNTPEPEPPVNPLGDTLEWYARPDLWPEDDLDEFIDFLREIRAPEPEEPRDLSALESVVQG